MKHKILIIPLVFLLLLQFSVAQEYSSISPEWLINSSGDKWDVVCDMVTGTDSSIFLAGNYTTTSKIKDRTATLTGDDNSFIVKLDNRGNELWQTHLISAGYSYISSLSCDSEGAVYACGTFKGSLNVGTTSLDTSRVKSLFILKLDNNGEIVMLQQIPGNFSNSHLTIANNSKNELLLVTSFKGRLQIDNRDYTSLYYYDILIAKIDNNGKFKEVTTLHGKGDDRINDIACTGEDGIYITGSFEKDLLFGDKIMKTKNGSDAFLIKLNDELKFVYGKQIGGIYDDYGKSISIDNNGKILLAGSFAGELSLPDGFKLTSNGVLDVFIIKYDKNGNLIWADSFGGGANDYVSSMTLSPSGNIYIDGTYRGTIEKENFKIESSDFSNDIFLAKYDTEGKFRFLETAGDTNVDFGRKLISDTEGYIYLSGDFTKSLKFLDKETTEAVDNDFFISRLYDCEESPKVQLPADTTLCGTELTLNAGSGFEQYFWNQEPGTEQYIVDTCGIYVIEAIDEFGCVSMDTIIVQLNQLPEVYLGDTITVQQGEIVSLIAPSGMKEYLWSDGSSLSFLDINTSNIKPGEYIYWVQVTDENKCVSADEVLIKVIYNTLSMSIEIKDIVGQDLKANISPNPAKDIIVLHLENIDINSEIEILLYTNEGVRVMNYKTRGFTKDINISLQVGSFETGSYTIRISNGTGIIIKNIVLVN